MGHAGVEAQPLLEATGLTCVRGGRTLFRDVTFGVTRGALLRVTGANGSGKTSLLRIVCGLALAEAGAVRWCGKDVRNLREMFWSELLYIGHANALKDDLTAEENLRIGAALAGIDVTAARARDALEGFGIGHCAALPARVLSQGQRRRAALARLHLSSARTLWVLDEPFAALDEHAVQHVEALVAEHLAGGSAVILTTHQALSVAAPATLHLSGGS